MVDPLAKAHVWGRLLPIDNNYPSVELIGHKYTVGRDADISIAKSVPLYMSISKVHFEIEKGEDVVFIIDTSQNGTFVNGSTIEKGKRVILQSTAEIALSSKDNKAFVFLDKEQLYPAEVTSKYTISKQIGRGAFGEVKLAFKNDESHKKLAVKIIQMKADRESLRIQREVDILRKLDHPCIVKFVDAIDTNDKLYIFLELVEGGELSAKIKSIKQFCEIDAKVLFYQMVLAIKYLHENRISHRDLKPENILLSTKANQTLIKITDFGLSKFVDSKTMLRTQCGTLYYLAPEVIESEGSGYTCACDVWSLGVILFICLTGKKPFSRERTDFNLKDQIINGTFSFPDDLLSENAKSLINAMIKVNLGDRITMDTIQDHPWLNDALMKGTVDKLMYPDGGVSDAHSSEPIAKRRKFEMI